MLDAFIRANIALCKKITPSHLEYISAYDRYNNEIIRLFLHPDVKVVLDVGAGRRWRIDPEIKTISGIRLIGADASMDALIPRHLDAAEEANETDQTARRTGQHKKLFRSDPEATMATSSKAPLRPSYKQHTAVDDHAGVGQVQFGYPRSMAQRPKRWFS